MTVLQRVDTIHPFSAPSVDIPALKFTQSGSGAVSTDVQTRGRRVVYATDFLTAAQIADVIAFTAAVNVATAVQAAIDYAFTIGAELWFPAGKYNIGTTTLIFKNKVRYKGAGADPSRAKGTVIHYTGTGDAVQINNPINSSTSANISIEGIWFHSTTRTAGKASFADVGSTYLSIKRCGFSGNDWCVILDQSELADLDECNFDVNGASATGAAWLVNNAEHTVGASAGYTNRISIKRSQFNSGVGGVGIADDGGYAHVFEDNNYNGFVTHIRAAGVLGLSIRGGEWEGATDSNIVFSNLARSGAAGPGSCRAAELGGGMMMVPTAGNHCVEIIDGGIGTLLIGVVYFGSTAAAKIQGAGLAGSIITTGGHFNAGGGDTFDTDSSAHFDLGMVAFGSAERIRTNIAFRSVSATGGIGYGAGAGGTVSQDTSKSTTVVLNKVTGEITMNSAALAGDTTVSFTLTNSAIAAGDHVIVQHVSGGTVGSYTATAVAAGGSATVYVRNVTTGSLSEAIVLKFTVFKATTS